jgi:3-dehydroquinate synthase
VTTVIQVGGEAAYDVLVGHGLAAALPALVAGAASVLTITDSGIADQAQPWSDSLRAAGCRVEPYSISAGEQAKSLETLAGIWDRLGELRLTRSDAIVAIGGGAVTDVAGFAAATWLRGVRVVHVPTTLLGMVDAAIGGKTAINTAAGKNLVGAFHPPAGVIVDLDVLGGLPDAQWVNGMAEVVKAGFIADPAILDLVDADPVGAATSHGPHTRELIERSIAVKAGIVSRDPRESGPREYLNYGHTLGHAIEQVEHFRIPHGHAVSVGMVFAAALGRLAGTLDGTVADRHVSMLRRIGLPTGYRASAFPELAAAMRIDKKSRGAVQRFVVLAGLGEPVILDDPAPAMLEAAYLEVAER